jgi:hypothetical protein
VDTVCPSGSPDERGWREWGAEALASLLQAVGGLVPGPVAFAVLLVPIAAAAGAIGAPLLGWLCERAGVNTTLVLAGAVTLLATLAAASLFGASPQRRTAFAHRVLRRQRGVAHPAGHPHQRTPLSHPQRRARVRTRTKDRHQSA